MYASIPLTDEAVSAAVEGSTDAVQGIVVAMNDPVRLMVYARLHPTGKQWHAVEDLCQLCMESLISGISTLKSPTVRTLRSFLSTIVTRRVADYLRDPVGAGRGRVAPVSLDSNVGLSSAAAPLWQLLSGGGTSPLSAAKREDQLQLTLAEMELLNPKHREVITLAFFDELTTAQIGERMEISRAAATMLLARAVKSLRKRLTGLSQQGTE